VPSVGKHATGEKAREKLQLEHKAREMMQPKRAKTHVGDIAFGCCFHSCLAGERARLLCLIRSGVTFSNQSKSSENARLLSTVNEIASMVKYL